MMMQKLNGVDLETLTQSMNEMRENPDLARFNFQADNRWVNGTHNRAFVKDFYEDGKLDTSRKSNMIFEEDEPPVLLGENKGANPVEYVLVGLSGCLTTALVAQAAARGIRLNSVESHLEGDLDVRGFLGMDPNVRNGYENINITFKIDADASDEELHELVQAARERSPVYDVVTNKVPVNVGLAAPTTCQP